MARYGEATYGAGHYGWEPEATGETVLNPQRRGGYDVFVKLGSPAAPGEDLPVRRVDRATTELMLPEADLGLQPNATYYVDVRPFNQSGHAEQGSGFSFPTDSEGHPLMLPSPVTGLSVKPVAAGFIIVQWVYDEPYGLVIAEEFKITAVRLGGTGFNPAWVPIPHQPPRRTYRVKLHTGNKGPWRIYVYSRWAGQYIGDVAGVDVLADATPAAAAIADLSAV